mgnify:CR=1 FL=1
MHVWERLKGFIIKAGTILFLACVVMWLLSTFGFADGSFGIVEDSADSLMAIIGGAIALSLLLLAGASGSRLQLQSPVSVQRKVSFLPWAYLQMLLVTLKMQKLLQKVLECGSQPL